MAKAAAIAVRLPKPLDDRLREVAERSGQTMSYFVAEALLEYLDDLEDERLAIEAFREHVRSGEDPIPAEEVYRELGISA